MPAFAHLHVASGYSLRYGAALPGRLVERAAERGITALALTDRDTLAGSVRFAKACAAAGVRPLFGADLAHAPHAAPHHRPATWHTARERAFAADRAPRVVLLAEDRASWAALCHLISAAHAHPGAVPRLAWADLERHATGLTALLGPASEPIRALGAGDPDRAAALLAPWREIFGPRLRLEVAYYDPRGTGPGSLPLAARTLNLAAEEGVEAVLAGAVRYADADQAPVADVLDSARRLTRIDPRRTDGGERWLKPPSAMAAIAERVARAAGQDASGVLAATARCADRLRLDPEGDLGLGQVHFPEPQLVGASPSAAARLLAARCRAAMAAHGYDHDPAMLRRLEEELAVIEALGYPAYFLTVAQIVDDTRRRGIRVAARGSAAGSLVVHLLGIATANPVQHGLLMERFLSPRRTALPDIDIDVESARRLEVYRAIFDRFGPERVATVCMPETYRIRYAIRDTAAALGLDPAETGDLAKAFPHIRARDARTALAELPELRAVAARYARCTRLWDLVEALDALPRSIAMHPCGVLLSDRTLMDRTPVVPSSGEHLAMSQFDKDDVEDLGLLKLDVLGVRMQSAMAHAVAEVHRTTGRLVDLDDPRQVAPEDPAALELIRSARTVGCFQLESPGQRDLIGRLQPTTVHDLVVDISLFRPGPVAADMVRPFIAARHGLRRPRYPHPDLVPVLRETYGVVVWHEQVVRILAQLTGCDRATADEARRALADTADQARVRHWFTTRARARGYRPAVIEQTWRILEAFGAYGFCKAHAVAFAVPTYQSAWLKAHHPAAFYAGVLTHDPGMYPKRLLLADARRHGITILPLDVNRSGADYRIEPLDPHDPDRGYGLRLALSDLYGIHAAEIARITAGRPYASLTDLWQRARPGRPTVERLARLGALDPLTPGLTRHDILQRVAQLHDRPRVHAAQLTVPGTDACPHAVSSLPDLTDREKLHAELRLLRMDASRHIMTEYRPFLDELRAVPASRLTDLPDGAAVLVAGVKSAVQTPPIRSGRRVIFTTLDDETGLVDLAFFDDTHPACARTLLHSGLLVLRGTLQRRGPRSLTAVGTHAWDLTAVHAACRALGPDAVRQLLAATPDGRAPAAPVTAGPAPQLSSGSRPARAADIRLLHAR
ncbi:DNA polymerase III subunit alpha [Dactylosporangium sp. NPDC000555]|uniref:DNA polymerase III subunit alpha n=1 Tax=Dactylosporangium sp. NPDC000555 TaxID=3154260 RepID=UPI0033249C3B